MVKLNMCGTKIFKLYESTGTNHSGGILDIKKAA